MTQDAEQRARQWMEDNGLLLPENFESDLLELLTALIEQTAHDSRIAGLAEAAEICKRRAADRMADAERSNNRARMQLYASLSVEIEKCATAITTRVQALETVNPADQLQE